MHQCARCVTDPKEEHRKALRWLGRDPKEKKSKGTIIKLDTTWGLKVYVGVNFVGNWDSNETQDIDTEKSRYGYYIIYMGCHILWKKFLQIEISLNSTESEYIGLSYALLV